MAGKNKILFFFLLLSFVAVAQPTYNMSNLIVDDCEGILLDSEAGPISGAYDHNENFTFSICIPDADQIVLEFSSFCTEEDFDFLSIYDGPNTSSGLIGIYTGDIDPPTIVATSGCLTLNFTSDPNVVCTGWEANWYVEYEIPVPPPILPIGNVPCQSNSLVIDFGTPVLCSSIVPNAFSILGPQLPNITSATPIGCVGGMTSSVELMFAPPLTNSGNYEVIYTSVLEVECADDIEVVSVGNFAVTDCPLSVEIEWDGEEFCAGECTEIDAIANGGDGNGYTYSWSHNMMLDTCCIEVCPLSPTMYTVVVSDGSGAMATDSILVSPGAFPIISIPNDTTFCQSADPFILTTNFSDGIWAAQGILEREEETGLYDPGLVMSSPDTITFTAGDGCETQIEVNVIPLDEGSDDASCIGAAPFIVSGGLPIGGTWSGENITPMGLFTPPDSASSFEVTYTHPNGCIGTKTINIDSIQMPIIDTLCQSDTIFRIPVIPFGGVWTGPGIINGDTGLFDPDDANSGDNMLFYEVNGCSDSINIFVKPIDASFDFSACPVETPFVVPGGWNPAGGTWSGIGITNPSTGMYDPSIPNQFRDTLTYELNGCVDSRIAFILYTEIELEDTLGFCPEDEIFDLTRSTTGRRPSFGTWTGPGVTNLTEGDGLFNPAIAGEGLHTLIYTANTCIDSMHIEVFPTPVIQNMTVCELDIPLALEVNVSGGEFNGTGIINPTGGIFDPEIAGVGLHTIGYESAEGCYGEGQITVIPFLEATISGVTEFYCYKDTLVNIITSQTSGTLTLNGQMVTSFNPATLGTGEHVIRYVIGEGNCQDEDVFVFQIGESIIASTPITADTICYGQSAEISVDAIGGSTGNFIYTWNNGLGFGKTHYVNPTSTTTYTVSVSDDCSNIATADVTIFVHPQMIPSYSTGPEVCFEDSTWAILSVSPAANYTFVWDSSPPFYGDSIYSYPTSFNVDVTNNETGCSFETLVQLPGFSPIAANFNVSPNEECITTINPTVQFLDFSIGATNGVWDFGDGTTAPYVFGENLEHTYNEPGDYLITLILENEGDCPAEHEIVVCVEEESRIFAPNAFSPNTDGVNDEFFLKGIGIGEIEWHVFNRFGEIIFTGNSLDDSWDGYYKGRRMPPGVYVYLAKYKSVFTKESGTLKGFVTVLY